MKVDYFKTLVAVLVLGSVLNPASAVAGLFVLLAHQTAEKYFTRNIADHDRQELVVIKAELARIKAKQDSSDISKAFGPR